MRTYSALVAVNQDGVVALVVDHLKDAGHGQYRNCLLLGALHGDVTMRDAIGPHERLKSLRDVLVHQSANTQSVSELMVWICVFFLNDLHNCLETQLLEERIVGLLGIAASVDSRNYCSKVDGLTRDCGHLDLDSLISDAALCGQRCN